jgi:hypothetical protein
MVESFPPYPDPFTPWIPSLKDVLIPQTVMDAVNNATGMNFGWCKAHACPCTVGQNNGVSGTPDPRCKTCFGRGTYWDDPIDFVGAVSFMHTQSAPDEPGAIMDPVTGRVMRASPVITIPFTNSDGSLCPAWPQGGEKDAFIETDGLSRFQTPMIVGQDLYLPYRQNVTVNSVTSYDPINHVIAPVDPEDYTVSGPSITFSLPEGTGVVVDYYASLVYVAWRVAGGIPHMRPAGLGANLPRRFHIQTLDVWLRTLNNPNALGAPI